MYVVGPPTQGGKLGTLVWDAKVYWCDIVMAGLCKAKTPYNVPCLGGRNVQGSFLGNNINEKRKINATPSLWCALFPPIWKEILWYCLPMYTVLNYDPVWLYDPSMFVNIAILLVSVAIPTENPDSCCWMYSKKAFNDGNHIPIFLILSSSHRASFIVHTPPA